MALSKTTLEKNLNDLFTNSPKDLPSAILKWADCIDLYGKEVEPTTSTSEIAKVTFISTMQTIVSPIALEVIELAITNYTIQLSLGMDGFVATAPPSPIVLQQLKVIGLSGGSNKKCLNFLVETIDSYFRSGIAVSNSDSSAMNWQ